mmetsp:Transcript_1511/g.2042  ORF Transcript_1511/g.2042 Transcript_1511/m.2042 type:complete len:157 (-) Transcript_1511:1847-2317(-)
MLNYNLFLLTVLNYGNFFVTALLILGYMLSYIVIGLQFENDYKLIAKHDIVISIALRLCIAIVWIGYAYDCELDKKIMFSNGSRKVREFLKLKSILNILVPALVRDKVQSGKKNFSEEEGQVTIVFVDLNKFDKIVNNYNGSELIELMDKIYNVFD